MSRKKTQKVIIYVMLGTMLLTTLLAGASTWL
ncbi:MULTISPECIES: stressosome-associated protein Prli42 [Bacillaceae]|nr:MULTISPECIES: stressosome-associated protein Prli42 [Bacillaceae]MDX8359684.1 stressosome-associated protein Prli42 [Cytobacillus sp. IB215316]MDX8364325.1 stressosome-associated protein Prli42 [Cytobacillus sp. IB215665]